MAIPLRPLRLAPQYTIEIGDLAQEYIGLANTAANRDRITAALLETGAIGYPQTQTNYTFCNEHGQTVGRLFTLGDQLVFEGNASESARLFLLSVMRAY